MDAAFNSFVAAALFLSLLTSPAARVFAYMAQSLAVINAGISASEDGSQATLEYRFLPGDFVYFTFEIAGFAVKSEERNEVRKISLRYELTPEDSEGRALSAPSSDEIKAELSPEDKNWVPKRRASFLIPSFVAAGTYHVHVLVRDLFANTETTSDIPFSIGGVHVKPAAAISVQNFRFFRRDNDPEALTLPAYTPGDTVYARFEMVGYKLVAGNKYHLAYGISVFAPDGKLYVKDPQAANIESDSFYPAQFVPGNLALSIGKDAPRGEYIIDLNIRDVIANQTAEFKQAFAVE